MIYPLKSNLTSEELWQHVGRRKKSNSLLSSILRRSEIVYEYEWCLFF